MSKNEPRKIHYAWWIFACCCAVNAAVLGVVANTAGIYLQPVSTEMGWSLATMNFYLTIIQIVMTISLPIVGFLLPKINIKIAIGVPCFVMGATYALSALFQSLLSWYIAGVVLGICYAFLLYIPIPLLINNWFKKKVGTVLGIVVAGASLVAAFTNPIGSMLIAEYGWRLTRVALGSFSILLSLPLVILVLHYKPSDMGLRPYGEEGITSSNKVKENKEYGLSAKGAFKTTPFYTIFIFSGLLVMCASMLQQVPGYAVSEGMSATVGATGVSCIMVGGIIGKIMLGMVTDKYGYTKTTILACCLGFLGVSVLLLGSQNVTIFFIGTSLFGISYASITIIPPMAVRGVFGTKDYSQIYSWITVANGLFGALTPIAVGIIFDSTKSYRLAWYFCLVAFCFVIILALITKITSKKVINSYI